MIISKPRTIRWNPKLYNTLDITSMMVKSTDVKQTTNIPIYQPNPQQKNPINKKIKQESIIVCSAHNDDFVIGVGGTIAKYIQEKKKVTAIVFSYGENSHPWLKKQVVQKMRSKEAEVAAKILGCKVIIFDLKENHFLEDIKTNHRDEKLQKIFTSLKPNKVFTHSSEDPHPDHRAVHEITLALCASLPVHPELYVYPVWNALTFKTSNPSLYIDIKETFWFKLRALRAFSSQQIHIIYPVFLLLFRAFREGLRIHSRFAEKFFRLK